MGIRFTRLDATTMTCLLAMLVAAAAGVDPRANAANPEAAEHPHIDRGDVRGNEAWPLTFDLPQSVKDEYPEFAAAAERRRLKEGKLAVMAWTPPQADTIRAVLLIMENTDSLEFGRVASVRRVAEQRKMGIVYLRFGQFNHEYLRHEPRDTRSMQAILDEVARRTGLKAYRHAPWIVLGKSSVGRFPAYLSWAHPERVVAGIVWHGEVPPWGKSLPPDWARLDEPILFLNVNGESEWGGTWHRHVRPGLLNYRANGWLPHQVVSWGVGHGDYPEETSGKGNPAPRQSRPRVWDYMALFIDKALEARLPADGDANEKPLQLRRPREEDGYSIDPRAIERLLGTAPRPLVKVEGRYVIDAKPEAGGAETPQDAPPSPPIRRTADVPPAERAEMFWVPDRELAEAWRALHTRD